MPLKSYKPTSPGRRFLKTLDYSNLTKKKPEKALTAILNKRAGRSKVTGQITIRFRGGGFKRKYRLVDFEYRKPDIISEVKAIEYDPNRSAFIALVLDSDGEKRYVLACENLKVGDKILFSKNKIEIKNGNSMPLKYIPTGTFVYNIELQPGQGGKLVRAAGSYAQLLAQDGKYSLLKFPSGEIRKILSECQGTIGQVSNIDRENIVLGKAGARRWRGRKPKVRGKAMNPKDHPHGGGEGRSPIGLVKPKTKWGKSALGVKTRRPKKMSDRLIVKRRT
ncbi:MAG: 50S ribosomal protein L2 [Patescibacteria group bacterium]